MLKKKFYMFWVIVLIVFLSTNSFADGSLSIPNWKVDSTLLDNGDLFIREDITFDFEDKFNGVYRYIVLDGVSGIDDIVIHEMLKGVGSKYELVPSAKNGDQNVFTTEQKNKNLEIKIFSPSKDEQKTFRIEYTLRNVAIKHRDTGELYYKFLGKENSTPIQSFSANIKLPQSDRENTKIFSHGPLNGSVQFIEDDLINLKVSNVPENTFIEARILFPQSFIDKSNNIGTNTLESIMGEELSFIKAREEKIASRAKAKGTFNNISMAASALVAGIFGFIFNKLRRNTDLYDSFNNAYPEDISPAELRIFMTSITDSRSLMTTIFDLSRRGYIDIGEIEGKKKKKHFQLSKTIRPRKDLLSHEEFLLDWLLETMGDGNTVSTKDIEDYRRKNYSSFGKDFLAWQGAVKADLKKREYYDNSGNTWATLALIVSILTFIMGITSLILEALYGILPLLLSIFLFVYSITLFTRKSDQGLIQYQLWKSFKKDLAYGGIDLSDFNVNMVKDKILIYALALGLPMKSIDGFRDHILSESYSPNHWAYWYFITNRHGGSSFEDSLNSSFYGSSANSTSSSIGGGGGFSGGGGGGAGGGGAGGF